MYTETNIKALCRAYFNLDWIKFGVQIRWNFIKRHHAREDCNAATTCKDITELPKFLAQVILILTHSHLQEFGLTLFFCVYRVPNSVLFSLYSLIKRALWLVGCLLFYVPLKNVSLIWRRHHYPQRAAKSRPLLCTHGLWAGRDLYVPYLLWPRFFFQSHPKDRSILSPLRPSDDTQGDKENLLSDPRELKSIVRKAICKWKKNQT
jgi:hypothetical protein